MKTKPQIIILHESLAASLMKDAATLSMFAAMIGLGVALSSPAMQWFGGGMFLVWSVGTGIARAKRLHSMSIAEARMHLDQIESGATR